MPFGQRHCVTGLLVPVDDKGGEMQFYSIASALVCKKRAKRRYSSEFPQRFECVEVVVRYLNRCAASNEAT